MLTTSSFLFPFSVSPSRFCLLKMWFQWCPKQRQAGITWYMGLVASQWLPSKEQISGAHYYFLKNCRADWLAALQLLMLVKPFEWAKLGFLALFAFGCTSPQTAFTNYFWGKTESTVILCCHKTFSKFMK